MKSVAIIVLCISSFASAFAQEKEKDRLKASYDVLKEIIGMPEKGIPHGLLEKAKCVVVFPSVKKAGFGIGGSYGRGVVTCRGGADFQGPWSAPAMYALEGGSPASRSEAKPPISSCW